MDVGRRMRDDQAIGAGVCRNFNIEIDSDRAHSRGMVCVMYLLVSSILERSFPTNWDRGLEVIIIVTCPPSIRYSPTNPFP